MYLTYDERYENLMAIANEAVGEVSTKEQNFIRWICSAGDMDSYEALMSMLGRRVPGQPVPADRSEVK